jgi:hypothetical protein
MADAIDRSTAPAIRWILTPSATSSRTLVINEKLNSLFQIGVFPGLLGDEGGSARGNIEQAQGGRCCTCRQNSGCGYRRLAGRWSGRWRGVAVPHHVQRSHRCPRHRPEARTSRAAPAPRSGYPIQIVSNRLLARIFVTGNIFTES